MKIYPFLFSVCLIIINQGLFILWPSSFLNILIICSIVLMVIIAGKKNSFSSVMMILVPLILFSIILSLHPIWLSAGLVVIGLINYLLFKLVWYNLWIVVFVSLAEYLLYEFIIGLLMSISIATLLDLLIENILITALAFLAISYLADRFFYA